MFFIQPVFPGQQAIVKRPAYRRMMWTKAEDEQLQEAVEKYGIKNWSLIASQVPRRSGKQCRERYRNHLDKSVKRTPWTQEEDTRLAELHAKYGNAWTKLAEFFEGRTDNCIKNRWNSTIKKRLERMELGQPLVMKRGRKPKIEKPPNGPEPDCSSPVEAPPAEGPITIIKVIPLSNQVTQKLPTFENLRLPSLPAGLPMFRA